MTQLKHRPRSLLSSPWGQMVERVIGVALQAVDPEQAVLSHAHRQDDQLIVAGQAYDLDRFRRVLLIAFGKAGLPMGMAMSSLLGERLTEGVLLVKEGYGDLTPGREAPPALQRLRVLEAGHPTPDTRGLQAARQIAELLESCGEDDLVICLVSGGASALLVSPVAGVSLEDLRSLTSTLLACGASIDEINSLRKHLEGLKGGKLARLAAPARVIALILSDVVGDRLDVIASGPTAPDGTTFTQAWAVLKRYQLLERTPPPILDYLSRGIEGEIPENPATDDPLFSRVQNVVVAGNRHAASAAVECARDEGLNALLLTTYLQGEARQAGRFLAAILRQAATSSQPLPRPGLLVAGGETTVTVLGAGLGGRNQELALAAVEDLAGLDDVALVSLATDGGDGPTDAAGAVVTGATHRMAVEAGLHPAEFLARNDAYHFFEALGDLLKPGPTLTNVNDLIFLFAF